MTHSLGTRIATIGLAGLVVFAGSTLGSYAANGGPLLLGHKNSATKTTTLKNSKGTALSLKSKSSVAPLKVSNANLVTNLNADLLDGKDGAAYRNQTFVYSLAAVSSTQDTAFALPGLPPGKYLASYSVAASFSLPGSFGCLFIAATGAASTIKIVTEGSGDNPSYVSGSGYLDTTTQSYVLDCEQTGGGTMTLPIPPANIPSQVVLTRVDDVTASSSIGAPITISLRPGAAGRVLP